MKYFTTRKNSRHCWKHQNKHMLPCKLSREFWIHETPSRWCNAKVRVPQNKTLLLVFLFTIFGLWCMHLVCQRSILFEISLNSVFITIPYQDIFLYQYLIAYPEIWHLVQDTGWNSEQNFKLTLIINLLLLEKLSIKPIVDLVQQRYFVKLSYIINTRWFMSYIISTSWFKFYV